MYKMINIVHATHVQSKLWFLHSFGHERRTIKKAEHQRIDAFNCGVGEDS